MNAPRLMVLGLLNRNPMHGYELRRLFEQAHADRWAEVLPGSIYHALKSLESDGHIREIQRNGRGPRGRTAYEITASGKEEFGKLLREAWRADPNPYPTRLYAVLGFLGDLPPSETLALIEAMKQRLRGEIQLWDLSEQQRAAAGRLPEFLRFAFENARGHLKLDLKLLDDIAGLLSAS